MRKRRGLKSQMRDWNAMTRQINLDAKHERDGKPAFVILMGRKYETLSFPSNDAANAFMERTPNWGVIFVTDEKGRKYKVHLARMDDKGTV